MSDAVIKAEKLGKKYVIGHQAHNGRYTALRDVFMQSARDMVHKTRDLLQGKPIIQGDNIEEVWALRDVSFEVRRAEVVGIIGRNGAGKSTLLKILSRITEPTSGRIRIRARVASLLEVGTGFHPELTGRENIYLNGAILGMTRIEVKNKFDQIVAFAEVDKFLDTPVKRYSSGMYVRLAFAVAVHVEPEILLVDEVLAVGDAAFQKKCLGKMGDVAKEGRTVLFVSHNMNAVERLCGRAILLEGGEIKEDSCHVRHVIRQHLFGRDTQTRDDSEWVNVQNEFSNPWFMPSRLCVCDSKGNKLSMPVHNTSDMWVQIEGTIDLQEPLLTVGYAVFSETGTLLYWSYPTDQPESSWPQLTKGHHVLRGRVPARFLNEGSYRIELIGGLHYCQWLFEPGVRAPSVYLRVQGGLSDSPYWMAKRPGETAPVLEWVLAT